MGHRQSIVTLAIAVAISWTAAAAPREESFTADVTHVGTAEIFRATSLTIVYPAKPDAEAESNRRSAMHRAAHLRRVTGARIEVAPDDGLSPAALEGNLLLLGWSNRIVGREGLARPFEKGPGRFRFLDVEIADPTADLIFYARSPWSETSFVVFWSRIDPPRDRFMPLPSVGSHWGIVSDFRVLRQGMYLDRTVWPPARNADAESNREEERARATVNWSTRTSEHYRLHYDPAVVSSDDCAEILRAREDALAAAVAAVGPPPASFRIDLTVYADEEQKRLLTGVADPAHSVLGSRQLHMIDRWARSTLPHEEVHHILQARWGSAALTAMYEGFAVDADGSYRGVDLETQAAILVREGRLPSASTLLDEAAARGLADDVLFPAAGIFARWVRATAPEGALSSLYRFEGGSLQDFTRVMGIAPSSVDASFREWASGKGRPKEDEATFRLAQQEAARAGSVGDYAGVAAAMRKALAVRPDDPQTLFNLASAQLRTREWDAAERHLRRILELSLEPDQAYFVPFAHYQLGRVFDVRGRRDEALEEYRKVLELPDVHDSHALARKAIDRPVTLDSLR